MASPDVRKGMPDVQIGRQEFDRRYREQFFDPAFRARDGEIEAVTGVAFEAYEDGRKAPVTVKAGAGYADPDYDLSTIWVDARRRIDEAEARNRDPATPSRILLINGSMRSDQTCPGEISKSWRLMNIARDVISAERDIEIEVLDLSRLASEFGRRIFPCKSCVSTAMPLCHWPCSCYPNYSLGQVNDWMNDIYPMWVAAHGIMIVTPVNWYQAPSGLKAMIDRLVCADGGNPDPTSTQGKDPAKAKEVELAGWHYPRHLAGRVYSVIAHGDTEGVETLEHAMCGWLSDMGLIAAGRHAQIGSYIGYYGSYAESHDALDKDDAIQQDVKTAARSLVNAVRMRRKGAFEQPDERLRSAKLK
jgi:multimeric flavodoxin WrbA